jgi:flagellar biosynthesis chaperone FliJ
MRQWRLDKNVNLSGMIQLLTVAGLIVGSWINLQRQLDLLGRDVKQLLTAQEKYCDKMEQLQERTVAHEYRIREIEKRK